MTEKKIKKLKDLKKTVGYLQKRGKKVIFTNGCFDILHLGHIKYLEQAAQLGDKLIVAVNSDTSVRRIKGKTRPLTPLRVRMQLVAALECVDYVIAFTPSTPAWLIKSLKPDILVKGSDWKTAQIVGAGFVQSYGGKVKRINFIKGYSTSAIISRIKKNK
ncbi:MAG: D-glycero-beta-D-manno-heptose 1-phosphate adenylyltransferase [Candidatus Omnitrophica bacterium]|nr:D-glycero-beta-D-manno-heptose 1-phosphate adenylyltransferase [Candidatus Omnitrophota bacterium]